MVLFEKAKKKMQITSKSSLKYTFFYQNQNLWPKQILVGGKGPSQVKKTRRLRDEGCLGMRDAKG